LCGYCNQDKPKKEKTKEKTLKKWIDENYTDFVYNKKVNMDSSCRTHFPDFLKDCRTFFLIVECDEFAHKNYEFSCERIRENNIVYALGLPCVFIRYNPDRIKINSNSEDKQNEELSRLRILKSYIDYYLSKEYCDNEVVYLFYN
jgi:hypothetical protein